MAESFWTEERTAEMIKLWELGQSASQIALALGCKTRNAVVGKVHRLRTGGHVFKRPFAAANSIERSRASRAGGVARVAAARQRDPKPKRERMNNLAAINAARKAERLSEKPFFAPPPVIIDASFAKPWTERAFGECAYPIAGEGADTLSCCAPTNGATYCAGHAALMFVPPKDGPRRFVKGVMRWAA